MSYYSNNREDWVHVDEYNELLDRIEDMEKDLKAANEDCTFVEKENETLKMKLTYLEDKCRTLEIAVDRYKLVVE